MARTDYFPLRCSTLILTGSYISFSHRSIPSRLSSAKITWQRKTCRSLFLVSCSTGSRESRVSAGSLFIYFFSFLGRASESARRPRISTRRSFTKYIGKYKEPLSHTREAGGCCHAVIRFPSHFQRAPLHLPRYRERSPVSFPLSSSRSPRAADATRTASIARDGDADKFTRDECVGSRAVRTSNPRARTLRRRAFRATCPLPLWARLVVPLDSSIEGERERSRFATILTSRDVYQIFLPFGAITRIREIAALSRRSRASPCWR